jgi:two-component system, NarL family, response regulator
MTIAAPIRIMIVDDHTLVRRGMSALLAMSPEMKVVAEAADGVTALERYREHLPDVTLMDLRMPNMGGVDAITAIRKEFPRARFVVLTTYDGDDDVYRALTAGAQAYLLKDVGPEKLFEAILAVNRGEHIVPADLATRALAHATSSDLTDREVAVLRQIVDGKSNRDIAEALSITENTVKGHVKNLFDKLGVTSRTQAAMVAVERGLFRVG